MNIYLPTEDVVSDLGWDPGNPEGQLFYGSPQ
jgi:hypothetical protein